MIVQARAATQSGSDNEHHRWNRPENKQHIITVNHPQARKDQQQAELILNLRSSTDKE